MFSPDAVAGADAAPCDWIRAEIELEFPGGVVEIDPASVVGRRPAVPYDVLPSPFGFRKALDDGVLTDLSEGFDIRFRVEKPLAYFRPAGLPRPANGVRACSGRAGAAGQDPSCVLDSDGKILPTQSYKRCEPRQ